MKHDLRRGWIIACSHEAYHNLSDVLKKDLLQAVTDDNSSVPGRWNTGMFVFDTDLGEILHNRQNGDGDKKVDRMQGPQGSTGAKSKLVSSYALRRLNSRAFSVLDRELREQKKRLSFLAQPKPGIDIRSEMIDSNSSIELAFAQYFTNLCLRFLPQNIYHYPEQSVVSCDVRSILTQVTSQARAQTEETEGKYTAGNSADSKSLPELSDVEVEFVTELMGLGSPAFRELLTRHGALGQLKF